MRNPRPSPYNPPPPAGWGPWLRDVYGRLHRHFGHRGWWPAETAFEVIIGAYLTQNVAWTNVARAIDNLRAAGLLSPEALRRAGREQIEACIRPSGYFRQKAGRLIAFLDHLYGRYGGDLPALLARPAAELRAELLAMPGVGPETADSIVCYAAHQPIFVADAYTRRIFHRLGAFTGPETGYDEMQSFFHAHLAADAGLYNDFHAQVVALGNALCLKRAPRCGECPLADLCPRQGVEPPAAARRRPSGGGRGPAASGPPAPAGLPDNVRIIFKDKKNSSGRIRNGEIVLYISSRLPPQARQEHIEALTRRLLAQAARTAAIQGPPPGLTPCEVTTDAALAAWAAELNERHYRIAGMGEVRFKAQRTRWGSCSGKTRNIYISDRLRGGPRELLEYVLIHEICHLREFNHGPRFWRLVGVGCPDYQQRRAMLRQYGSWLDSQGL